MIIAASKDSGYRRVPLLASSRGVLLVVAGDAGWWGFQPAEIFNTIPTSRLHSSCKPGKIMRSGVFIIYTCLGFICKSFTIMKPMTS